MVMVSSRNLGMVVVVFCFMIFIGEAGFALSANQAGSFTGTWTANGTRELLPFGQSRETALIRLSGHVNLKDLLGDTKDYWSTCIGLVDTATGSNVRCVWRSLDGQEVYIVLRADRLKEESNVTGEIVGGTGAATGITGTLSFQWSTLSFQGNNNITEVGGYARDLKGAYQLPQ